MVLVRLLLYTTGLTKSKIGTFDEVAVVNGITDEKASEDQPIDMNELLGRDTETEGRVTSPWAYAPYWPYDRKANLYILLADQKNGRQLMQPKMLTDIPVQLNKSDTRVRTVKIVFPAPPQPGNYHFRIFIYNDTYVGGGAKQDLMLKVDPMPEMPPVVEDDISEPDENSLAGQLAQAQGKSVKKSTKDEDNMSGSDDEVVHDNSSDDSD